MGRKYHQYVGPKKKHDKRENDFAGLLYMARKKGYKLGWAAHRYKAIHGDWPDFGKVTMIKPSKWLKQRVAELDKSYVKKKMKEKAENYTGPLMKHHPKTITGRLYEPGHDDGTPPWD